MKKVFAFCSLLSLLLTSMVALAQSEPDEYWTPEPGTTWQWQLSGDINTSYLVDMYDIDLFDAPQPVMNELKQRGAVVICYFSAGSYEDWRPDAALFPEEVIGSQLDEWEGEKWLNIADIESLSAVMLARLDLAALRGCDGVEPDNVDGYTNETGFSLTYEDQLAYNLWLAEQAHARGLSIGLKNDLDQIVDLEPYFDWALNEQCFQYEECELLLPFIENGKAVFGVEYELGRAQYCSIALEYGFSWLHKTYDLADEAPNNCSGAAPVVAPITRPTTLPSMVETREVPPVATAVPTVDDEYDNQEYDDEGYDEEGYDRQGYDRDGYDRDGYDRQGYDEEGYDRQGYDEDGYDEDGYDRQGYDEDGYDRDGCTREDCE